MKTEKKTKTRANALDALRGIAIIGMVFSGVFPHENLWPAWMFHAQVGPPDFSYHPEIPGITWVDLVFPFFLFSMGAAFPLALRNKLGQADNKELWGNILKRGALLVFFAIALRHTNPGFLKAPLWINYLSGLVAFGSFFLIFMRWQTLSRLQGYLLKGLGFSLIFAVTLLHHYYTGFEIGLNRQDIIILVLANMAVFGAFIWIVTVKKPLLRLGVLACFAAIWLTREFSGSLSAMIYNFHPAVSWFYQFAFLKYLNIVIPGMLLGDLIVAYREKSYTSSSSLQKPYLLWICTSLLLVNLLGLFTREIFLTVMANVVLCFAGGWILTNAGSGKEEMLKKLFYWGTFWLFLGLLFEPMDGGIKKDPSSFSYWFITSGLAFFTYLFCELISTYRSENVIWKSIVGAGQNPMVAYVAGSFCILPLFYFTGISKAFGSLKEISIYFGPVKSILVTACVVALASFTARKKWFWRT
ncbi:DUF5009 domain-containing protein [Rapidithrix thailandica]|uniref:DUF5009 domain-containing protein n=1 Tax=Rapidithrix thailandica TaxID=413964 RepID=A0AAW9RQW8_9BACT